MISSAFLAEMVLELRGHVHNPLGQEEADAFVVAVGVVAKDFDAALNQTAVDMPESLDEVRDLRRVVHGMLLTMWQVGKEYGRGKAG